MSTAIDPADKLAIYRTPRHQPRGRGLQGNRRALQPRPPQLRRPQLKYKFVESASFVVTGRNAKRSVTLGLYDGDKLVPAGNVTIPPNHAVPESAK